MAAPLLIDYVADWRKRLRGRLYTQFRNKVTWEAWVQLIGRQAQDTEDAVQSLLTLWDITNSFGANLDRIGRAIGQKRLGVDDITYRLYLFTRVLANKSTGTPEEIFSVMRALFGSSAAPRYTLGLVKAFSIRLGFVLTRTQAIIAASFLHDSKESGARANFEWQEFSDDQMFEFADIDPIPSTTISVFANGGDTTLQVASVVGFPAAGRLQVAVGNAFREYVYYSSIVGSTFQLTSALVSFHPVGHVVHGYSSSSVGLGFDDGYFAGAVQA